MSRQASFSIQTRRSWLVDAVAFLGGLIASLSGIYFLFLPTGGYKGGRNPMYGVIILFSRDTWDAVHTWSGVAMIAVIAVHLAIHWKWVTMMGRRVGSSLRSGGTTLSRGGRRNLVLNVIVAVSFLITAVSGIYLLFAASGEGGHGAGQSATFLFSRTAWDLLHTWAGVVLIVAAVVHLAIHWRWVLNVTRRMVLSLRPRARWNEAPVEA